ncbi:hypothetical protein A9K55_005548 [Cordyceps militaris]|uniref:Uncharacterized protein n=1 Tax=Cordyceps militaris TaxID=73501 RepID=A0A2H4SCX9_CORMI|nr:hypothetical protein A9K55_005548 [Cordyceps militaris]
MERSSRESVVSVVLRRASQVAAASRRQHWSKAAEFHQLLPRTLRTLASMATKTLLTSIRYHLQRQHAEARAPNGFDEALKRVCASENTLERRLLEQSLLAWAALVSEKTYRSSLNQLSANDAEELLRHIMDIEPSDGFKANICRLFKDSGTRATQRRGSLDFLLDNTFPQPQSGTHHTHDETERHVTLDDADEIWGAVSNDNTDQVAPRPTEGAVPPQSDAINPNLGISEDWGLNFALLEPEARHLPRIFTQIMCDRIVKENGLAKISIQHNNDLLKSFLRIEIIRSSVPYLALQLFGITLKDRASKWAIVWPQGSEMEIVGPDAQFCVCRAREEAIEREIGAVALEKIKNSPDRATEVTNGEGLTRLVRLVVFFHEGSNAWLEIQPGDSMLEEVKSILWQNPF